VGPGAVERLRHQAALQVRQRETGLVHHEVLAPDGDGRGLAGLPAPSPGDLFFDIEADPWAGEAGLEYLFGVVDLDQAGAARYRAFWALDQSQERCAFEAVMDLVVERLARHPDMHVYHYAPYETAALKRLMGRHGTREAELDRLLRAEVFVDLYRVVRQGVRVSQDSYSLKKLEPLYLAERTGDISGGAASIVAFERWRETGDGTLLRSLEDYNRLDCVSLVGLRQWLEQRRVEAEACFGAPLPRPRPRSGDAGQDQQEAETATQEMAGALCAGMPDDPGARTEEEEGRWLLAQLLSWHRREAKPGWWAYFDRLGRSDEELRDDSESIGELDYGGLGGRPRARPPGRGGPAGPGGRGEGAPGRAPAAPSPPPGRAGNGPWVCSAAPRGAGAGCRPQAGPVHGPRLPGRAGTTRVGQDGDGSGHGRRARGRAPAGRHLRSQPQGHHQPAERELPPGRGGRGAPARHPA